MPPRNAASVLSPVALLVVAAVALMAGLHAVRGPAPEALLQGSQHYALVELPDQQPEVYARPFVCPSRMRASDQGARGASSGLGWV